MDIVSQKQSQITLLKDKLFTLQRLRSMQQKNEKFANNLMQTLKQQNIELQNTIIKLQEDRQKTRELLILKEQLEGLKKRNYELEQMKSHLNSQKTNMGVEIHRITQWNNRDLSRTNWGQSMGSSRNSGMEHSRISDFVVPSLVDSRYTAQQYENKENLVEQQAQAVPHEQKFRHYNGTSYSDSKQHYQEYYA